MLWLGVQALFLPLTPASTHSMDEESEAQNSFGLSHLQLSFRGGQGRAEPRKSLWGWAVHAGAYSVVE